jgi:mannose-6-phosphate isomerase
MGDITGESVYEKFGVEFPLLIKLIEAKDDLSVQVHPGDDLARERHKAYGKTEMWHILRSENGARIYSGFASPVTRESYIDAVAAGTIGSLLNSETAEPGDTFFTPSGRIHAIGAGIVLAEIQQTSDITYRIHDWGRKDSEGKSRDLHTDLALDAIDFTLTGSAKLKYELQPNRPSNLVRSEYFDANIIRFNTRINRNYNIIDSFVIFLCTQGSFRIRWDSGSEAVSCGETVLIPASIGDVELIPEPDASILEIYINQDSAFKTY